VADEDHALATEVRIVTFDPWAVHRDSADPARRTSCETQDDAPLLATPAVSEATPDTFTAADRDPRHQHAPLDYLIDETGLGPPIAPVGSDELVDEEWEELERAEGDAIAGLIEAAPDEEELIGAIESLDVEKETNDGAYFDEDEVGGVGEWDDTLDGSVVIETTDSFDNPLHARSDCSSYVDDYDPTARQDVWKQRQGDADQALARARAKAARVVSLLDVVKPPEQDSVLDVLVELFRHLQHHRTFVAIEALALEGISPESLRSVIALRRCWLEHPEWWVGRYGWGYTLTPLRGGAGALSWRLASCICEARAEFPPEQMIDPDWFEEWLALKPFEKGFLSFPDYLRWKINAWSAELLFAGLEAEAREADPDEFADPIGWYRRLPTSPLIANVIAQGPNPLGERPPPRTD
jgi:hypothetical protein